MLIGDASIADRLWQEMDSMQVLDVPDLYDSSSLPQAIAAGTELAEMLRAVGCIEDVVWELSIRKVCSICPMPQRYMFQHLTNSQIAFKAASKPSQKCWTFV